MQINHTLKHLILISGLYFVSLITPNYLRANVEPIQQFTHSDEWSKNSNFTTSITNAMGGSPYVNRRRIYARVDLSAYDTSFTVTDAVIRVKKAYGFGNGSSTLLLYTCEDPWNESVTWTTRPTPNYHLNSPLGSTGFTDSDYTFYPYNFSGASVNAQVQAWIDGTASNHGFIISAGPSQGTIGLCSDDYDPAGNYTPELHVQVSGGGTYVFYAESMAGVSAYSSLQNTSFGNTSSNILAYPANLQRLVYVKWDDTDLASLSGQTVTNVEVKFYRAYSQKNFPRTLKLEPLGQSWQDGTLTWNNAPALNSSQPTIPITCTYYDSDPANTIYEFSGPEVDSLVQSWIASPAGNYGFRLSLEGSTGVVGLKSDLSTDLRDEAPDIIISPHRFAPTAPQSMTLDVYADTVLFPVNRKLFGVGLLDVSPHGTLSQIDDIDETTYTLSSLGGTSLRVWTHHMWSTQSQLDYYESIEKHIDDIGVTEINGMCPPYLSPSAAYYNSSSDTNVTQYWSTPAGVAGRITSLTNLGIPFTGWEIWNEPQFTQNGNWQPDDFARYVFDCAVAIRNAHPSLNIYVPGHEDDLSWNVEFFDDLQSIMDTNSAPNAVDGIVTHPYDFYWNDSQYNMGSYYARACGAEVMYDQKLKPKYDAMKAVNANWNLVASEWNVHPRVVDSSTVTSTHDMAAAIFAATMLRNFMVLDFDSAQFFVMRGDGNFSLMDTGQNLYPTGHVLSLFAEHLRGNLIDSLLTTNAADEYEYDHPYDTSIETSFPIVTTYAAYDNSTQTLCIMLINRHYSEPAPMTVNLHDFNVTSGTATYHVIGEGGIPETTNYTPVSSTGSVSTGSSVSVSRDIPAHSVTAMLITGTPL